MELSEYERLRIENIKKNEEFLRSLELTSVKTTLRAQSLPVTATKKRRAKDIEVLEPTRRSSRVTGVSSAGDLVMLPDDYNDNVPRERKSYTPASYDEDEESERKRFTAPELSEYIQKCNPDHFELVSDKQVTHGHYRISYMSAKALALRLSKIACRKGIVDKMLVFYYGLRLANLKSIARQARYRLEGAGVEFSEPYSEVEESNDDDDDSDDDTQQVSEEGVTDTADSPDSGAVATASVKRQSKRATRKSKDREVDLAVESMLNEMLPPVVNIATIGIDRRSGSADGVGELVSEASPNSGRVTRSRSIKSEIEDERECRLLSFTSFSNCTASSLVLLSSSLLFSLFCGISIRMISISDIPQWKRLEEHAKQMKQTHLRDLLQDSSRCFSLMAEHNGIFLDFCRERVQPETMEMLFDLAGAAGLEDKRNRMATGSHINSTEDRSVMHIALRSPRDKAFYVDEVNVTPKVYSVLDRIEVFSNRVRSGDWLGATGKPITAILSIGIGGSYLGPEFVYEALRTDATASKEAQGRTLRFLANVDPVDSARALEGLNPETTLVVIVSKTFTTAETMLNARTVKAWLLGCPAMGKKPADVIIRQHMVAVSTAVNKAVDFGIDANNVFGFWDWVGGRYSVCSAVGILPLSLHYSYGVMTSFLEGAHNMDTHFYEAPLRGNLPVLMGLIGVWNSSFLGYSAKAILPYAQALTRFAAHIQQVDMESNGKRVSIDGTPLAYECGEIVFGEPGTNGQHSFYQLLHQGRVVPAEFIGFCQSPIPTIFVDGAPVSNHDELMSNFFAQPDALAYGKTLSELQAEGVSAHLQPHKEFPGNRPSLSLLFPELTAYSCGQLLALYEHRVAVQGFVWNINSFDQYGVELGKILAGRVRAQLAESRADSHAEFDSSFNVSTTTLISRYIKNVPHH